MPKKIEWKGWIEISQLERLKAVAEREKVSVAWAVRKAIDVAYPAVESKRRAS